MYHYWLACDIETAPIDHVEAWVKTPSAPANYKDADKIAAYIQEAAVKLGQRAALDWNTGRIAVLSWQTESMDAPEVRIAPTEAAEAHLLRVLWVEVGEGATRRPLLTFNGCGFDVPFLVQRSRYLNVSVPRLDLKKWSTSDVIDLYADLTFGGIGEAVMSRSLDTFARRFGLPDVADPCDGADVPALIAAGDYDAPAAHCRTDVIRLVALARRLGYLQDRATQEAVA